MKKNNLLTIITIILIAISSKAIANTGACYISFQSGAMVDVPGLWGKNSSSTRVQERCFPELTEQGCRHRVEHFKYLNLAKVPNSSQQYVSFHYDWLKGEPCRDAFYNN